MSRLDDCFAALRAEGRPALIPYVTAGDPAPEATVPLLHELVAAGADIIELGVPFSDPMADGPVIQLACERALAAGTSLRGVLAMVAEFRRQDSHTPLVLMGYLNPVEAMGAEAFAEAAAAAGVDGVLTVDLTVEEADALAPALRARNLDPVFLVAPTTAPERVAKIAEQGRGYLYYVSLKGVTGSANLDVDDVSRQLATIRAHSHLPVAVGFGIRTPELAAAVGRHADGVVVGSALVELIGRDGHGGALAATLAPMAEALRGLRRP